VNYAAQLAEKIRNRSARTGVLGLGYVGLPLAVEFAKAGFSVTGIDVEESKVRRLQAGRSYIDDVASEDIATLAGAGRLRATNDFSELAGLDTVNICVPTPLRKTKDPDLSYIVAACTEVARHIKPGTLVILESTTYPGTTEELVRPMLERDGRRVGETVFLCFSPERVDPGNRQFGTKNIPKVVGGVTPACTELAVLLYSQALDKVMAVSSTQVAEMVKLLENTFRMINIAMVNELAIMSHRMGIDVWEVIDAAATKPFGFMPFYPGPGLGGHCIPVDPFYLSWKSRQAGIEARFIELAGQVNAQMPLYVVDRIQEALNSIEKPVKNSRVHLLGAAYKKNVSDVRESPALDVALLLEQRGARVSFSDPYVPAIRLGERELRAEDPVEAAAQADCVVIITDHACFPYAEIVERAALIFDTRNALRSFHDPKIVRL
jgi:UDP-N-acetyl-D-glucosamine dehydrogenase